MAELLAIQAKHNKVKALLHNHHLSFKTQVERDKRIEIIRSGFWGTLAFVPISPLFGNDLRVQLKNKPDIIHVHMPNVSAFWLLFSWRAKQIPWVVHWHADVLGSQPTRLIKALYPVYRWFENKMLRRASAVISTSPNYLNSSVPLRAFRQKCHVVPLGLPDVVEATKNKQPDNVLKILVVGRLSYYKGHNVLIHAIHHLELEQKNHKVEVVFVGNGECERDIRRQILELNIESITLKGRLSKSELETTFDWCDLLCLPSIERTEAFGLVILEAARKSKPALVTDVQGAGMSWVVDDGVTGWVVKPQDACALADKISYLLSSPEQCDLAGKNARKKFSEYFSIDSINSQIEEIYQDVINKVS